MDTREKVRHLIRSKTEINDESQIIDLEKGIYNWSIDYADKRHMIKNWKNSLFIRTYLEKARSVVSNLDKTSYIANIRLSERLLNDREFMPHDICYMKPENLFPEKWHDTISAYMKKFEHAYEQKDIATTDMFKCAKCKKRQCVYYSLQTRSSDESETLFILCTNCNHSWRQN